MKARTGFTLIELTTAIVISGVVALLAYGSVQAGLDSGERVERHRMAVESVALLRSIIVDALRHPASAPVASIASFSVTRGEAGSLNDDRLQFVSRGVSPPHGAGALWNVVLEPTSIGLRFRAQPLEKTAELAMESVVSGIRGMSVRLMPTQSDPAWATDWASRNSAPYAVEIRFFDAANRQTGPPLVVVTVMETSDGDGR